MTAPVELRCPQCCAGFGLGVVLAVFTSLKLVLILAGVMLVALAIRILLL